MRAWKHIINIAQYITEDNSKEAVLKAANGVMSELARLPQDEETEHFKWEFEEIAEQARHASDDEADYLVDEFNYKLNNLYDWADNRRIWLGI
jgi:hypothetical protein